MVVRSKARLLGAAGATALAAGLLAVPAQPAVGAGAFCAAKAGVTANVYTGPATGAWEDDANWTLTGSPGTHVAPNLNAGHATSKYACIPAGKTVRMTEGVGVRADVQLVDVAGTLRIERGAKLYVLGSESALPSTFRAGSSVVLSAATLGGSGRIDALGAMTWSSLSTGAATIASRNCALNASCASAVTSGQRGLLELGPGAVLTVNDRGVNLEDGFRIVARGGTVRLTGSRAYIAADRGTRLELRKAANGTVGRLRISNDGGYYEGRTLNGLTTLSALVNEGLIVKDGGTGTSVIAAAYTRTGGGTVRVDSGTLNIGTQQSQTVRVDGGAEYGNGRCASGDGTCSAGPAVDTRDPANGSFRVPLADNDGAKVRLFEVARSGYLGGRAVEVHADGLAATPGKPAILRLRFDDSILGGKHWRQVAVYRKPSSGGAYAKVPACTSTGRPPAGKVACVDRRGLAGSSRNVHGPGDPAGTFDDVVMVIRTVGNSRWVGR